jgi:hypothetical protein
MKWIFSVGASNNSHPIMGDCYQLFTLLFLFLNLQVHNIAFHMCVPIDNEFMMNFKQRTFVLNQCEEHSYHEIVAILSTACVTVKSDLFHLWWKPHDFFVNTGGSFVTTSHCHTFMPNAA